MDCTEASVLAPDSSNHIALVVANRTDNLRHKYRTNTFYWIPPQFPIGLGYIAAILEQDGFRVDIIDNYLRKSSAEDVAQEIIAKGARYAGLSTNTLTISDALSIARIVKSLDKRVITILGGPHASLFPERMSEEPHIDVVITGEGEYALRDLLRNLRSAKCEMPRMDNKVIHAKRIDNLDALPFPARHLFEFPSYNRTAEVLSECPADMLASSRGCPFSCAFCSSAQLWNRIYRKRSPSNVVDEVGFMIEHFGSKAIYFREDNFTLDRRHVEGICDAILDRGMSIPWECESRVDTLTKPLIEKMAQAGCKGMWFGIESGSPRILKTIQKGTTPEQAKKVFRWCKEVGIETGAALMVGFPSETLDDVRMTRDLALELKAKMYSIATYVGFPKSEMYAYALENDLCEARHGDLSIVRNEHFSFTELVDLEREIAYAVRPLRRDLTEFIRWLIRGIWGFLWKGQRLQRVRNGLVYLKNLKRRITENRRFIRRLTG
jgi:radical SAM superfamily enzyme YgiQ (UPF0313 family)